MTPDIRPAPPTLTARQQEVAALHWTHEKPTAPGFYWYAGEFPVSDPEPVYVEGWNAPDLTVSLFHYEEFQYVRAMPGRWYGPIMPPAHAE